jgi:hypothetical protein
MIAARSDRVAGLADELLATAAPAAVKVSAVTASVAINERKVTAPDRSPTAWERTRDERSLIDSSRPRAPTAYRERLRNLGVLGLGGVVLTGGSDHRQRVLRSPARFAVRKSGASFVSAVERVSCNLAQGDQTV